MKALLLVVTAMMLIGTSAEDTDLGPPSGTEVRSDDSLVLTLLLLHPRFLHVPLVGNIARVNKGWYNYIKQNLPEILSAIITSTKRISHSDFVRLVMRLVDECKQQPDIALAKLEKDLTEETAPLFFYRLLSIPNEHLVKIEALFDVIVKIKAVADLMPGWVTVLASNIQCDDDTRNVVNEMGRKVGRDLSIEDFPEEDYSGPLLHQFRDMLKSQPTLARNLFFKGYPIDLNRFDIKDFEDVELAALLPFATNVVKTLSEQLEDLIDSGHSKLVTTIFMSEAFFSSKFLESDLYLHLQRIIYVLINTQGQHDLLRLLLESPLPLDWVVEFQRTFGISILMQAVHAGNRKAVDVLRAFTRLIEPTDEEWARSYLGPEPEEVGPRCDTAGCEERVKHPGSCPAHGGTQWCEVRGCSGVACRCGLCKVHCHMSSKHFLPLKGYFGEGNAGARPYCRHHCSGPRCSVHNCPTPAICRGMCRKHTI